MSSIHLQHTCPARMAKAGFGTGRLSPPFRRQRLTSVIGSGVLSIGHHAFALVAAPLTDRLKAGFGMSDWLRRQLTANSVGKYPRIHFCRYSGHLGPPS